ncbi:MAG TPA: YggS family pyridoxal phosphate-dependent enzyme [Lacipirellulaceae bacterium]|nr:YggS family pyridoxal phosphate-dependent enzyme [Lacipirellulaceae bacterium]
MSIAENLHRVRERIARAAASAGRSPEEITLVGVTKYVGAQQAAELAAAGCAHLGESRPQELWKKAEALTTQRSEGFTPSVPAIHWHLVGHLQRNKVRRTLPHVALVHSVDSERLLAELNDACIEGCGMLPCVDVLLEVNTSGESAKHGLAPDDVARLLDVAPRYPRLYFLGLMTMAALEGGLGVAARNFASLRELRDRLTPMAPNCALNELSMGMSADFEVAIREGATIVRIGSLLWENTV